MPIRINEIAPNNSHNVVKPQLLLYQVIPRID
jgi:hypothetical protein